MYNISSNQIKSLRLANGVFMRADMDWYNKFFRYGYLNPQDQLSVTREYLFWTKPDLTILGDDGALDSKLAGDSYFEDCYDRYLPVIKQLQASKTPNKPFVNLLSAMVKSSFEIPAYNADDIDGPATSYGDQIRYRGSTLTTDSDGYEFSLEFQDTKYLELYHWIKMYNEWENKKYQNLVTIPDSVITTDKKLIDQMALYKIVVGADFETIIFYAKAIGVYPKVGEVRDVFANMDVLSEPLKYTIPFHAEWIPSMDPIILSEFNKLTSSSFTDNDNIPLYDTDNNRVNGVMCNIPYITYVNDSSIMGGNYKLKWR